LDPAADTFLIIIIIRLKEEALAQVLVPLQTVHESLHAILGHVSVDPFFCRPS
jgi:hypothetical protein